MYKIVEAKNLTANIYQMIVKAPRVAAKCMPGQFLIVRTGPDSERIALTICDYDREAGTITIVFQTVGASTTQMSKLKTGDSFHDVVGPLGRASELTEARHQRQPCRMGQHRRPRSHRTACIHHHRRRRCHWHGVRHTLP